jgi:hypothetical protein
MIKLTLDINDQVAKIEALEKDTQEQVRCTNAYPFATECYYSAIATAQVRYTAKSQPAYLASLGYKFGGHQ